MPVYKAKIKPKLYLVVPTGETPPMKPAVFAYGSLQLPEVMACVTGQAYPAVPARLPHFARFRIRGKSFPGIRPEPGASVEGLLYRDLTAAAIESLDAFEDDFYLRQALDVVTCSGAAVQAFVYVMNPQYHGLLEDTTWDLEHFKRHSLGDFLHRCSHFASSRSR